MTTQTMTLSWFAGHEFRLSWRSWLSLMTAGKRGRERALVAGAVVFIVLTHLLAWSMVAPIADVGTHPDKAALIGITGGLLLSFSLMLSQAMESVTRSFFGRSDLELILSSPIATGRVFAVRIGALAASTAFTGLVLAAPAIDVLAVIGGRRWLAAFGVVMAMGLVASALAVASVVTLFRSIGPKRTRLTAQIIASVINGAFIIGLQIAAILSYDAGSRFSGLAFAGVASHAPAITSWFWWPARAALGNAGALAVVVGIGFAALALAVTAFSTSFGDHAVAASSIALDRQYQCETRIFHGGSPLGALRYKEWRLLRRAPWLISQTMMHVLYLLPPALLLWRDFSYGHSALVLVVAGLVMASGQLAGGLAWLAISGEDAPDLMASAPLAPGAIIRAKLEAVMTVIAVVFAVFLLPLAWAAPYFAAVAAVGIVTAAGSTTTIQLWFRAQANRSRFRRRQTPSRIATVAETSSSITWAATAALAAAGTWLAAITGLIALLLLVLTRAMAPGAAA